MTKDASDAWTIVPLGTSTNGYGDGIGNYAEQGYWVFPTGQNGAVAGTYFSNADTTNPAFGGSYFYQLRLDGDVNILASSTTWSINGSGASNSIRLHTPLANVEGNISSPPGYFRMTTTAGGVQNVMLALRNNTADPNYYNLVNLASATLTPGTFVVADNLTGATYTNISFDITYQAFVEI